MFSFIVPKDKISIEYGESLNYLLVYLKESFYGFNEL
jgi:hypothetical protein